VDGLKPKARLLDEYLVASARIGDRKAFALPGALERQAHGPCLAAARDPEAAKDAVQESWGEIVKGLSRLVDAGAFPAWAYRSFLGVAPVRSGGSVLALEADLAERANPPTRFEEGSALGNHRNGGAGPGVAAGEGLALTDRAALYK